MTNAEKLKKIIASYSTVADYTLIKLNRNIKNNYVYEGHKRGLAGDIYLAWPNEVDRTHIQNELFESIKTGKAIFETFNIDADGQYK